VHPSFFLPLLLSFNRFVNLKGQRRFRQEGSSLERCREEARAAEIHTRLHICFMPSFLLGLFKWSQAFISNRSTQSTNYCSDRQLIRSVS
jgi:hypothetical protein